MGEIVYQGPGNYVTIQKVMHSGKTGAVLRYANPDPRKLHAVDFDGMKEFEDGIAHIEKSRDYGYLVLHGASDPVHAGADITQFAGDPDYDAIKAHLYRGTALDSRVKALWPRMRTVAVFAGDRYGGSVEWPLFAEYGVADIRSRIQFSEVHLGIVPGWNGILNIILRSNPANALYMGTTGNAVTAEMMMLMGIVQQVVDTPVPPDRSSLAADEWPMAWQEYADKCTPLLLNAALDIAVADTLPIRTREFIMADEQEFSDELDRRLNPEQYRKLKADIHTRHNSLGDEPGKDELKALTKDAGKRLTALSKPLAPKAVDAVREIVGTWGRLSPAELLKAYDEAGRQEADLCVELMHTDHRRTGINAVLSRNPADRIPVFD